MESHTRTKKISHRTFIKVLLEFSKRDFILEAYFAFRLAEKYTSNKNDITKELAAAALTIVSKFGDEAIYICDAANYCENSVVRKIEWKLFPYIDNYITNGFYKVFSLPSIVDLNTKNILVLLSRIIMELKLPDNPTVSLAFLILMKKKPNILLQYHKFFESE